MKVISPKQQGQQLLIAGVLLLILLLTRGHIINHLQDASWAVFFIAGFYLRSYLYFAVFWLAAFAVDLITIDLMGGQSYCLTPGYLLLIPAYAVMWLGGQWLAKNYRRDLLGLFKLTGAAVVATVVCFVISNGGFYTMSGRFEDMSAMQYASSVIIYLPSYLLTTLLYLGIAALIHVAIASSANAGGATSS